MYQSIVDILDDLRTYVTGRGRDDNFLMHKDYSPSSYIRCIDFSPWVKKHLLENNIFALAVFERQLEEGGPGLIGSLSPFEKTVGCNEIRLNYLLKYPLQEHFTGEFTNAKYDLLTVWILHYPRVQFSKILTAYRLSLKDAEFYLSRFNESRKTNLNLPDDLPNDTKLVEFQQEFRKLPLATRLHLFDIFEYSTFHTKKPKLRLLSDMTLYGTRQVGIDKNESAKILCQSKLITSNPDGTGYINPDYIDAVRIAADYATKMARAYEGWTSDIISELFHLSLEDVIRYILEHQ